MVVCHLSEKDPKARASETALLESVYRYYEQLTGHRGITILAGQGLGPAASTDMIEVSGSAHPSRSDGRMLASAALRRRIEGAGIGAPTPHPMYIVLNAAK